MHVPRIKSQNCWKWLGKRTKRRNKVRSPCGDFPGGPAVKTLFSKAWGAGLIPGQGTKIPHASQPKKNIKQKQYCNEFNKDFEKWSTSKRKEKETPVSYYNHFNNIRLLNLVCNIFSSVQFSHSVVSDSLRPHVPQHTRPPCPWPTPGVHPNPCPSSQWCHPTISSSVVPFSSCPQSFPAPGSFPMSQLFTSGGQSIGVSASTSVLPKNTQDWSSLGWTGWISLQSKGLSRVFSNITLIK